MGGLLRGAEIFKVLSHCFLLLCAGQASDLQTIVFLFVKLLFGCCAGFLFFLIGLATADVGNVVCQVLGVGDKAQPGHAICGPGCPDGKLLSTCWVTLATLILVRCRGHEEGVVGGGRCHLAECEVVGPALRVPLWRPAEERGPKACAFGRCMQRVRTTVHVGGCKGEVYLAVKRCSRMNDPTPDQESHMWVSKVTSPKKTDNEVDKNMVDSRGRQSRGQQSRGRRSRGRRSRGRQSRGRQSRGRQSGQHAPNSRDGRAVGQHDVAMLKY